MSLDTEKRINKDTIMCFTYREEAGSCLFNINSELYPLGVVFKAAYLFIGEYYIFFDKAKAGYYLVKITPKQNSNVDFAKVAGEFNNELLNQAIRYDISQKTKNIRELVLARALYSTSIQSTTNQTNNNPEDCSFSLDEIAKDWFEAHE